MSLAREAEALYVSDFRGHDDKSPWATETRESLRMSRQMLLADAGESAVRLLWMRDAIDFATLAIAVDHCFERPHRTLMRAHAGLGEIELALRAFEHCRFTLSEELGADPSPQTRALHLQILSGAISEPSFVPFTGRSEEVDALAQTITSSISGDGCDVICLTGDPGSGRMALLQGAAALVPQSHLRHLLDDVHDVANGLRLTASGRTRRTDITIWAPPETNPNWTAEQMAVFLAGLDPGISRVIAIVTSDEIGKLLEEAILHLPINFHYHPTGPLTGSNLGALASHALSGPPTARLLEELQSQSHGLAGRAITILHDWIAAGWIISTHSGLDLYNDAAAVTGLAPVGDTFRTLIEQLGPREMEFVHLMACLDRPLSLHQLLAIASMRYPDRLITVDELLVQLDRLTDLGVLRYDANGYSLRNLAIGDAIYAWLRPSDRARLEREFNATIDSLGLDDINPIEGSEI